MPQSLMLAPFAFLLLVDAANIIFNIFLAHALRKLKKITNFSYRLIFYMSISDICVGLLGMTRHISMLHYVLSRNQQMHELAEKTRIFLSVFVGISGRSILIIAVDRFIRMKYLTKYNSIMTKQRRVILIATNLLIGVGELASKFPYPIQPFSYIYFVTVQTFNVGAITSICLLYLWTYCSIKQRVNGLNLQSGPNKRSSCQQNNRPSNGPKKAWTDKPVSEECNLSVLQSTILPDSSTKIKRKIVPCKSAFEFRNNAHETNGNGGCRMQEIECKRDAAWLESGPIEFVNTPYHCGDSRARNDHNDEPYKEIDDGPSRWLKPDGSKPWDLSKPTQINVHCVPCNPKLNWETDGSNSKSSKAGDKIEIKVKQNNTILQKRRRPDKERNNSTTDPEFGPMDAVNRPCDSGIYSTTIHNERPKVVNNDGPNWRKCCGVRPEDELTSAQCKEQGKQCNPKSSCEAYSNNYTGLKTGEQIEVKIKPSNGVSYKRRRPDQEYARCVKFILVAVIICYIPSNFLYLYSMIKKDTDIPEYISVCTHGITLLNSSLNAIIFLICNRDFKRFTKNFLKSLWSNFLYS